MGLMDVFQFAGDLINAHSKDIGKRVGARADLNDRRRNSDKLLGWEHDPTMHNVKNPKTGKWEPIDKW